MLRIKFNREALIAAGGTIQQEQCGKGSDRYTRNYINFAGLRIDFDKEAACIFDANLFYRLPEKLESMVIEVSYYANFGYGLSPHRQLGMYRLRSAGAQLEEVSGTRSHYHLKAQADNLADLRELFGLILEGQIWPAKDYEREQVPPPYRHLRDLASEAWQLIRRDISDRFHRIKEGIKFAE